MFGRKRDNNPEIQKAREERDRLISEAHEATQRADKLVDDLLAQYEEANGIARERTE